MACKAGKNKRLAKALSLLEMIIAMALISVLFAVLLPQFSNIQNSWASRQGSSEALQNGRVLIDHLKYNLQRAYQITSVSAAAETAGYIEFDDPNGDSFRYDIAANNYVEYGSVGSLSDLAGPVSTLQFTCYDACDLDTPIVDVNEIRSVKVQTTVTNSASLGHDKTFTGHAYLRTNASTGGQGVESLGNAEVEDGQLLSSRNFQLAMQVVLSENGMLASILAYTRGPTPKEIRFAIYSDNGGEPGSLIVQSDATNIVPVGYLWHEIDITTTVLSTGTYWLAIGFEMQSMNIKQSDDAGTGQVRIKNQNATETGFDASWGASDESDSKRVSMYAVYTADSEALLP